MTGAESAVFLARVPLFALLSPADLDRALAALSPVTLAAGEILFRRGEPGDALYIVRSGLLEAVLDEDTPAERVLSLFVAGDHLGEMALLTAEPRTAAIRAVQESCLLALSKERFERLIAGSPSIALELSRVLSRRLAEANTQLAHRTTRMSVLMPAGAAPAPVPLMHALAESLRRQVAATPVIALLGLPAGDGRAAAEPVDLGRALDHVQGAVDGAAVLAIPPESLDGATSGALLAALGDLRRRFDHVLVCAAPAVATAHPAIFAHADAVVLAVLGPAPRDELVGLATELSRRGPPRLAHVALRGAPAPLSLGDAPPIRISPGAIVGLEMDGRAGRAQRDIDRLARVLAGATVGLALSGGAAQGVAHLGVMEALLAAGVPVDMITGTSGGALYGAVVASGMPPREGQRVVIKNTRRNLLDRADFTFPKHGVIRGARIESMIRDTLGDITFDDLDIPLFPVAADLDTGEEVVISEGPVYRAVRASISVPGLFEPYRIGGRVLVDGGVVNPLPVSVARRLGADHVIAVQVPPPGKPSASGGAVARKLSDDHNLLSTIVRSYYFAGDVLASRSAAEADVLIAPDVAGYGWRDYRSAPDIILDGIRAGREAVERIARAVPVCFGGHSAAGR